MNRLYRIRILLSGLLSLTAMSTLAQTSYKGMHLKTTDDARVALALSLDEIPNQIFTFTIPEVFTLQGFEGGPGGLGNFNGQQWQFTKNGASVTLSDQNYNYDIVLKLRPKKKAYYLDWKLNFRNNSDHTLKDLASFNCVSMKAAPLFKDDAMTRTFVNDINGNKKSIKEVAKTQGKGRRTMQFYPADGGIDSLSKSQWINQWDVVSNEKLSGHDIYIISKDDKWKLNNTVNGQVAYFFNNFEKTHGCVHAAPLISKTLSPGKNSRAKGSIQIIKI